ncbi:MAG TPA: alpha/beta fold hydrolase [Rhodospirillales bacterium]|nr:alpha/beta fold hydrolase [Rhodospirillales bacterium]
MTDDCYKRLNPRREHVLLALLVCFLSACSPHLRLPGNAVIDPELTSTAIVMPDGASLPLYTWPHSGTPRAIVLALHGFNDYGEFVKDAAIYLGTQGVKVYSYDQRGFGRAPHQGFWPGTKALGQDLTISARLLRDSHPGIPLYVLGHSMGGAVIMAALTGNNPPKVEGAILVAPAIWGRVTMPFYQRWLLALAARTLPWLKLSGKGLGIKPSDNIEMLRMLGRDPLVIKNTRIDTLWGLVNLMDKALEAAPLFNARSLILIGSNDQVINDKSMDLMLSLLPISAKVRQTKIRYKSGYHMLLRDLKGKRVWQDILDWVLLASS